MPEKRNAPAIPRDNQSAHDTAQIVRNPRERRVLEALLRGEWIHREQLDRIACASNSPDLVFRLRALLGDDAIHMQRFTIIDRDGRPSHPGRYRITPAGIRRLAQMGGTAC